jgi:hydrogenase nickel incorporation protein HypA/HybF
MHEYSIVQALMQKVEAEVGIRGGTRVHRIGVRIGDLAGVDPELLSTAFATFREAGICRGAELAITPVQARWICPGCARTFGRGQPLQCPDCRVPARLDAGDEILLDRIEMEVPDV